MANVRQSQYSQISVKALNADSASYAITASHALNSGGSSVTIKDEGVTKTTNVTVIDFTGAGVTATNVGSVVTVNIPGGGGGGGTPGGSNTQVQFNANGTFSGSSNFTFNSASSVLNITGSIYASSGTNTVGFFGTASWAQSASQALTASFVQNAQTASFLPVGTYQITSSWAQSASQALTASYINPSVYSTGSYTGFFTGSLFGTASWAVSASQTLTASYYRETDPVFVAKSASLATTGSNIFIGDQTVTGSLNISGSIIMNSPTASITGVDYIDFDKQYIIGTNEPAWKEGRLFYDSGSGALAFYNWESEVTLNIGQESWLRARNQTGVTITNGSVVKLDSAIGDRPTVVLAQSTDQTNTFSTGNEIIGMATHDIENGTDGFVTTFGLVNGLNTNAFTAGDLLWVSQSAGQFTNVPPPTPYDRTFVGIVTRKNTNNGSVFLTPLTPIHFHDISSVSASIYQQGDLWMYRSGSAGLVNAWINTKTLGGNYTISGSLTLTGSLTTNDGVNVQTITASFISASGDITGSLFGTASWAQSASQAVSSSFALTASYADTSLNVLTSTDISPVPVSRYITYVYNTGTSTQQLKTTSSLAYNHQTNTIFTTSSYAVTASYALNGLPTSGSNVTASFASSTTWTFTHNMNNRYPVIQTLDSSFNQIIPQNIALTDNNTATITFPTAISGYAIASLGGANITQINNTASSVFATTGSNTFRGTQTFSGSLIPAGPYTNNTSSYDLGSATAAWKDLYVSNGSIKMISGSNSASMQFNGGAVTFTGASVTLPSNSTVPTASYVTPYEGAWISYTPSWTAASSNPVIGNGSLQGWYKVVGKTCFVRGNIVMGSTTTFGSGEWYVSMPFTASHADAILMVANLLDNGTAWYNATLNGARAGFNYKTAIQYQAVGGTADSITPTAPFTWTNSDRFLWNGSYEIA